MNSDLIFHLSEETLNDVFLRRLIASTPAEVPRQLISDRVRVWWESPELSIDPTGSIIIKIDIEGGARTTTGRNATVSGSVSISMKPSLHYERGSPVVRMSYSRLDLTEVKAEVPGGDVSDTAAVTAEGGSLHRTIRQLLVSAFERLPISYLVDSFTLAVEGAAGHELLPPPSAIALEPYTLWTRSARIRIQSGLSKGLSLIASIGDHPQDGRVSLGSGPGAPNAAMVIGEEALDHMMDQLHVLGLLPSIRWDPQTSAWIRFESISVHIRDGQITLVGTTVNSDQRAPFDAILKLATDSAGSMNVEVVRLSSPMCGEADVKQFFEMTMRILFRAGHEAALVQRFVIPGSEIAEDAPVARCEVADRSIALFYDIPTTDEKFSGLRPAGQPSVAIVQSIIPVQAMAGAPITAEVAAQIVAPSSAPYDYTWTIDLAPGGHKPTSVLTTIPPVGAGRQPVGVARVTVVDSFGRIAKAEHAVQADLAPKDLQRHRRRAVKVGILAAAALSLMVGLPSAFAILDIPIPFFNSEPKRVEAVSEKVPIKKQPVPGRAVQPKPTEVLGIVEVKEPGAPAVVDEVQPDVPVTANIPTPIVVSTFGFALSPTSFQHQCVEGSPPSQLEIVTASIGDFPANWLVTSGPTPSGTLWAGEPSAGSTQPGTTQKISIKPDITLCEQAASAGAPLDLVAGIKLLNTGESFAVDYRVFPAALRTIVVLPQAGFVVTPLTFEAACTEVIDSLEGPIFVLAPFDVTLQNTGETDIDWIADGSQIGQLSSSSGSIAPGGSDVITVVPQPGYCAQLAPGGPPVTETMTITPDGGLAPVTFTYVVTPPPAEVNLFVSPTTFQQSCGFSTQTVLPPIDVVLDNQESTGPATWSISITPNSNGPDPWASANPTGGTIPPGGTDAVRITPDPGLCGVMPSATPVTFGAQITSGESIFDIVDEIVGPLPMDILLLQDSVF